MNALLAELAREIDRRAAAYPRMVARGQLDPRASGYQLDILREIRAEVAAHFAGALPVPGAYRWRQKLAELDRELGLRQLHYPGWVAKGRLQRDEAAAQIAAIEAVRDLYWRQMLAWDPPPGSIVCWNSASPNYRRPGAILYRQAVRDHMALVEAGVAGGQQALFG